MKKTILFLLAAGSFAAVHAQDQAPRPGSILLYGDLGFSHHKNAAGAKTLNWYAAPGIGYQFNECMTAGLNLSWNQGAFTDTTAGAVTTTNNMYRAGAFFRFTHPINNIFFAYAQLNAGYQGRYMTAGGAPATGQSSGVYANIMPAIGVHVGKGFALNFAFGSIGYNTDKAEGASSGSSIFNFTFGQQFNIGVSKNICGRYARSERKPMDETRNLNIDDED